MVPLKRVRRVDLESTAHPKIFLVCDHVQNINLRRRPHLKFFEFADAVNLWQNGIESKIIRVGFEMLDEMENVWVKLQKL